MDYILKSLQGHIKGIFHNGQGHIWFQWAWKVHKDVNKVYKEVYKVVVYKVLNKWDKAAKYFSINIFINIDMYNQPSMTAGNLTEYLNRILTYRHLGERYKQFLFLLFLV